MSNTICREVEDKINSLALKNNLPPETDLKYLVDAANQIDIFFKKNHLDVLPDSMNAKNNSLTLTYSARFLNTGTYDTMSIVANENKTGSIEFSKVNIETKTSYDFREVYQIERKLYFIRVAAWVVDVKGKLPLSITMRQEDKNRNTILCYSTSSGEVSKKLARFDITVREDGRHTISYINPDVGTSTEADFQSQWQLREILNRSLFSTLNSHADTWHAIERLITLLSTLHY
jgi:hypothetical protein